MAYNSQYSCANPLSGTVLFCKSYTKILSGRNASVLLIFSLELFRKESQYLRLPFLVECCQAYPAMPSFAQTCQELIWMHGELLKIIQNEIINEICENKSVLSSYISFKLLTKIICPPTRLEDSLIINISGTKQSMLQYFCMESCQTECKYKLRQFQWKCCLA